MVSIFRIKGCLRFKKMLNNPVKPESQEEMFSEFNKDKKEVEMHENKTEEQKI